MSRLQVILASLAALLAALTLLLGFMGDAPLPMLVFGAAGLLTLSRFWMPLSPWVDGAVTLLGAWALLEALPLFDIEPAWFWLALAASWAFAWLFAERLATA